MMTFRNFDTVFTKVIGKIPRGFHPYFDVLGYITMPVVWFVVVSMIAMYQLINRQEVTNTLAVLIYIPLATILKLYIRRQRPPTIYAEAMKVKSYSFPSSHAYAAALAGGYVGYLSFRNGFTALGFLLVAFGILVGVSRVYLGAHYPSDVLAGWTLGVAILAIGVGIV